jgi:CRP-like cAMP-binding protein
VALADDIAVLATAPLFSLMEHDALRLLAFAGEGQALSTGETLFRRGERSDGGYVVMRGTLALDASGDGTAPAFVAAPGCVVGRSALFTRGPRPATAVAREPSSVLRISPTLMRRVLEEFPAGAVAIRHAVADELSLMSAGLERVRRRLASIDEPPPAGAPA